MGIHERRRSIGWALGTAGAIVLAPAVAGATLERAAPRPHELVLPRVCTTNLFDEEKGLCTEDESAHALRTEGIRCSVHVRVTSRRG